MRTLHFLLRFGKYLVMNKDTHSNSHIFELTIVALQDQSMGPHIQAPFVGGPQDQAVWVGGPQVPALWVGGPQALWVEGAQALWVGEPQD